MRLFQTIEEAASEIERDIAKSPIIKTTRVQNIAKVATLHEALDYSYSVVDIHQNPQDIVSLGCRLGFWSIDQQGLLLTWLQRERDVRLDWDPGALTELLHPHLNALIQTGEGPGPLEPDYSYTDRLRFSISTVAKLLSDFPDTRRGYVPIFQPEDMVRATRMVRIPCSLGYQVMIRRVDGIPHLHLTYLQRACDFKKFWLTDLWLAREWQRAVVRRIKLIASWPGFNEIVCGNTTHFITSLHSFIDDEVY